jgi:hypothetical protein
MSPDDAPIPPDSYALRRINPTFMVADANGGTRPSSQAFQNLGDGMSVGLSCVLDEMGHPATRVLEGFDGFGLVRFQIGWICAIPLAVRRSATEAEPWHGDVLGAKTGSIKNRLAAAAERVVWPDTTP